jgi:hypothetical protein
VLLLYSDGIDERGVRWRGERKPEAQVRVILQRCRCTIDSELGERTGARPRDWVLEAVERCGAVS